MNGDDRFQTWLNRICERPLPASRMARVRMLARELAEGAVEEHWDTGVFRIFRDQRIPTGPTLESYLAARWQGQPPALHLLVSNGYLTTVEGGPPLLLVDRAAFGLLEETEPANIFISYKRSESSAFALLVLARLKLAGLEAFLDLALEPGEDWQAGLQTRIQTYDYLVLLLGRDTLRSDVVLQEIRWALEAGLAIIPVWHNGFQYRSADWTLSTDLDHILSTRHTIRVLEESAMAYNGAIVELLNRFGVAP